MKKVIVEVNGRKVEGVVAMSSGTLWAHVGGETFTWKPATTRRSGRQAASNATPGDVTAPMPGKIIKIQVAKGDKVSSGQVLLVMEAMKMEYTLKSQTDGVVSELRCGAGDQVELGQLLARVNS